MTAPLLSHRNNLIENNINLQSNSVDNEIGANDNLDMMVNEMVEQALVENLLDGNYYTTNDIELINSINPSDHPNPSSISGDTLTNSTLAPPSLSDIKYLNLK